MPPSERAGISAVKPVLRFLDETDLALSRSVIIYNLADWGDWGADGDPPSHPTIDRAVSFCLRHDLIEPIEEKDTLYTINGRGQSYLAGEITLADLEDD